MSSMLTKDFPTRTPNTALARDAHRLVAAIAAGLRRHSHIRRQRPPRYADLTIRRIVAAVERLAEFPESG